MKNRENSSKQTSRASSVKKVVKIEQIQSESTGIGEQMFIYNSIFENPEGMRLFTLDKVLHYVAFSVSYKNSIKTLWGYEPEIGKSYFELDQPIENKTKLQLNFERALAGEQFKLVEDFLGSELNKIFTWDCYYSPVLNNAKEVVGITVIVNDITEKKRAQELLKKSEERYRNIFENVRDSYYETNIEGTILEVSPSIELISKGQYKREELIGRSMLDFYVHPEDREKSVKAILKDGRVDDYELLLKLKDGEILPVSISAVLHYDSSGNPDRIIGGLRDISHRKQTENKLLESHNRALTIMNSMESYVYISDPQTCDLLFMNEYAKKAWGKEITGQKCYTALLGLDKPCSFCNTPKLVDNNGTPLGAFEFEYYNPVINRTFASKAQAIEWPDGRMVRMEVSNDITEKRRSQDQILENEKKYRNLFEGMAQGVLYHDENGVVISVNPAAEKILNTSAENLMAIKGKKPGWRVIREDGSEFPHELHPLLNALKTGQERRAIMGIIHPDSEKCIWVKMFCKPEFHPGETMPFRVFTTLEDITNFKEIQKELSELNQRLDLKVKQRAKEIIELANLQKTILDNAGMAIMTTKADGELQTFNFAAENLLGYSSVEVLGIKNLIRFFDKEDLQEFLIGSPLGIDSSEADILKFLKVKLKSQAAELNFVKKDGRKVPVKIIVTSPDNPDGTMAGCIAMVMDIYSEKEATKTLRESEERFHGMFYDHAAVMLLINPETGEIVEANKASEEFYGQQFKNDNRKFISEINALSSEQIKNEIEGAVKHHRNYFVFPHKLASGEIRTVEVHSSPINIKGQKLLFSIIHDITERVVAENSLRKSESENKAILAAVPDLLFRLNREGVFLDTIAKNEGGLLMPPEAFLGRKINEVLPPEIAANAMNALDEAFGTNETVTFEYEMEVQGELKYFEDRVFTISENEAMSIIRDISARKIAEKALKWNESLLKMMAASSPLAFLVVDNRTDNILYFNHQFCEVWGITHLEESMNRGELKNNDIIPDCLPVLFNIPEFAESCKPLQDENNRLVLEDIIPFNGGRSIRRFSAQIRDEWDEYHGRLYIFEDITERQRVEIALKMQSAAFDSFALAIIITDISGKIQWTNSTFTKLTQYSFEEAVGKTPGQLVKSGQHNALFYENMWDTILSKKVWSGEIINRRKDGSIYYEEETITPVLDSAGNISSFIAIKIDISQRKAMEQQLRESEMRWNFALENSGDGVWDWNIQTNEVFFSPQWKSMLGYSNNEIKNSFVEWESRMHGEDLAKCEEELTRHKNGETELFTMDFRMLCKDGTYKWILSRGKVISRGLDGKALRFIGTHTDINNAKKLELSLLEAIEREKELNELKSRFVSMASHEFRTPLTSILMSGEILVTYWKKLSEDIINAKLNTVIGQVLHLTEIVSNVMEVSKIQEGKIIANAARLEFVEFCENIIQNFNQDAKLRQKIVFHSSFKNLHLLVDVRLMQQVLNNLISNAIKYAPAGPEVKLELYERDGEIVLSIQDNGIGIPEADQKHLFQPFFRAGNTMQIQGNGLGLNIVKESIEIQGGEVSFISNVESGTTFFIHLPKTLIYNKEKQ